jgi:hypothetical protein
VFPPRPPVETYLTMEQQNVAGTTSAALLFAINLPYETVVEAVMGELDLTHEQATTAAREAQRRAASAHHPHRRSWTLTPHQLKDPR